MTEDQRTKTRELAEKLLDNVLITLKHQVQINQPVHLRTLQWATSLEALDKAFSSFVHLQRLCNQEPDKETACEVLG